MEHIVVFHESGKSTPEFTVGQIVQLSAEMFCVCGYKTSSGNRLANHLAKCERKSAYPSPARAKAATIQSASFPPLVTLDDADNASEDPSDRWLKAFVPSRKEEPGEGSKDAPDKKQAPQPEGGDPPSMLNILGLVRKPSTDESSLDRAPSDSEGLPDGKAEQPQLATSSEPPDQENNEVPSPGTSKDEGEKVAEGEEKMEVDEVETGSDQPVAPANIDDSTTEEALPDDKEPAEQMVLDDSAPAEETSPGDMAPAEETSSGDIVPAEENSPGDMAPAEETSPDVNAPIDETALGDRTSPLETEENCEASEAGDNRPSSQASAAADSRLSSLEAEARIPSPVAGSEIRRLQPLDDTEESVASLSCNENESSEIIRDSSELCQESEQAGSRERSSVSETEAAYTEDRAAVSPVNNEVPPMSGDKLADTFVESTDASLAGNIVPLLEDKAEPLSEQNKGEIENMSTSASE